MKTIGLIGGTGWPSTLDYYRILNEEVNARLGKLHSAQILMRSVDYQTAVYEPKMRDDFPAIGRLFADIAIGLQSGGADMVMICANMPHKIADMITENPKIKIPLLHIGAATGEYISKQGYRCVGLLGTRPVMEEDYIKKHYFPNGNGRVIVPDDAGRALVDNAIFDELVNGIFRDETRAKFGEIVADLRRRGAQAVVMGCTEIPILMQNADTPVPLLDTTRLHCLKAVEMALSREDSVCVSDFS